MTNEVVYGSRVQSISSKDTSSVNQTYPECMLHLTKSSGSAKLQRLKKISTKQIRRKASKGRNALKTASKLRKKSKYKRTQRKSRSDTKRKQERSKKSKTTTKALKSRSNSGSKCVAKKVSSPTAKLNSDQANNPAVTDTSPWSSYIS